MADTRETSTRGNTLTRSAICENYLPKHRSFVAHDRTTSKCREKVEGNGARHLIVAIIEERHTKSLFSVFPEKRAVSNYVSFVLRENMKRSACS